MGTYSPKIEWAEKWLKDTKSLYIGGKWVDGSGDVLDSVNPATGKVIGHLRCANESDVDRAVDAARKAFDEGPWTSTISHKERGVIMRKLSALIREHVEELATLETMDNGKTFPESCEDVVNVADFFDYYSGWCDKYYGEVNPVMGNFFSYTVREPVGVCGQIIPWNYPMDMAGYKLAPALAMRNVVVIKPSSFTSFSLLYVSLKFSMNPASCRKG